MIDEFYEFLDQRNLVEAFDGYIYCSLANISPDRYLSHSFVWANSDEGLHFWLDVNVEWNDYLAYWEQDLGKEWYLKGDYNGH